FFGKPALLHDFLFSVGSHSLKFQLVRKFQGRSDLLTVRTPIGRVNMKSEFYAANPCESTG
ncbi:hypothetical protein, partial [Burkholderia pseudomallei]|uniref:hypothetical protein n=1 Tax=Burkholderia pseudomallei TaxID=28450 RepID=UPI001C830835